MSELEVLINTPIGALFFVCGAISVFVLLAIFMLKKGTELHNVLGYIYFFGLSFANYAAAMAYYEKLLPLASVIITIPLATISLVVGLVTIIPKEKTRIRIKIHIISMICSTVSVLFGTTINWYHFNINPLHVYEWGDLFSITILSSPILILGVIIGLHFTTDVKYYEERYKKRIDSELDMEEEKVVIVDKRRGSEIIYKEIGEVAPLKRRQRGN